MKSNEKIPVTSREAKKNVNIKWNSRLFFQVGIIVSLLLVFWLMQTSFEVSRVAQEQPRDYFVPELATVEYQVEVPKEQPKPVAVVKPKKIVSVPKTPVSDILEVAPNTLDTKETTIPSTEVNPEEPTAPIAPSAPVEAPVEEAPKSIVNVEHVPVYPGCDARQSNAEKIDCMSAKINEFINRNFRKSLLQNLEPNRTHKIYVQFKIDSHGYIADVRANSTNDNLKKEAQRVVSQLPPMKPGRQGNKNVEVLYTVPIVFNIQ